MLTQQEKRVINAARLFCESTVAEMDELEGTNSAHLRQPEFMLLHEAIRDLDSADAAAGAEEF